MEVCPESQLPSLFRCSGFALADDLLLTRTGGASGGVSVVSSGPSGVELIRTVGVVSFLLGSWSGWEALLGVFQSFWDANFNHRQQCYEKFIAERQSKKT